MLATYSIVSRMPCACRHQLHDRRQQRGGTILVRASLPQESKLPATLSEKLLLYTDYLKDYLLWGLVRLQKMADIEEGMVLVARLLPLQVVPAKFDQLLAVCSHAVGQISHQQCCHLKQLHVDGI